MHWLTSLLILKTKSPRLRPASYAREPGFALDTRGGHPTCDLREMSEREERVCIMCVFLCVYFLSTSLDLSLDLSLFVHLREHRPVAEAEAKRNADVLAVDGNG